MLRPKLTPIGRSDLEVTLDPLPQGKMKRLLVLRRVQIISNDVMVRSGHRPLITLSGHNVHGMLCEVNVPALHKHTILEGTTLGPLFLLVCLGEVESSTRKNMGDRSLRQQ